MNMPRGAASMLVIMSGPIVWASCFAMLYGALSLGCRFQAPAFAFAGLPGLTWVLAALWLAHLALLGGMTRAALRAYRRGAAACQGLRFALHATLVLDVASLVGAAWIGFPTLLIPPCG